MAAKRYDQLDLMTTDVFGNPNVFVRNDPNYESGNLKGKDKSIKKMIIDDTIEMPAEIHKYFDRLDILEGNIKLAYRIERTIDEIMEQDTPCI